MSETGRSITADIWCQYQRAAATIPSAEPHYGVEYWLSVSPEERLEALELMRWMEYGQAACTGRMQKVIEVRSLRGYKIGPG